MLFKRVFLSPFRIFLLNCHINRPFFQLLRRVLSQGRASSKVDSEDKPKHKCPRPRCRKVFLSSRAVNNHLAHRSNQKCYEWSKSCGPVASSAHEGDSKRKPLADVLSQGAIGDGDGNSDDDGEWIDSDNSSEKDVDGYSVPPKVDPSGCFVENHPSTPHILGTTQTLFDKIESEDEFAELRRQNLFYPFAGEREWQFAGWLTRQDISMAEIDKLLQLDIVSSIV